MSSFEHGGHEKIEPGSPRSFGFTFAVVLGGVCGFGLWSGWAVWIPAVSGTAATGFLGAALAAPAALEPLNRLWFRFGMLLSKLTQPIILGILYFLIVTPIGICRRAMGSDRLQLKKRSADTYWIKHGADSGDEEVPADMRRQF